MADRHLISNIIIGQVYDQSYSDREVHGDKPGDLAGFSVRNKPGTRSAT